MLQVFGGVWSLTEEVDWFKVTQLLGSRAKIKSINSQLSSFPILPSFLLPVLMKAREGKDEGGSEVCRVTV